MSYFYFIFHSMTSEKTESMNLSVTLTKTGSLVGLRKNSLTMKFLAKLITLTE